MEVPSLLAPVDDVLLGSLEADRKTNRSTALERAGREATEIERRRWLSSLLRPSAILPSSRHRETARLLLLLRLRGGSRRLGAFLEPFRSQTVAITSCATMYRRAVRFTRGHDAHVKVVQAAMISCAARPHPSLSSPSSSPPPPPIPTVLIIVGHFSHIFRLCPQWASTINLSAPSLLVFSPWRQESQESSSSVLHPL